MRTVTYYTRKGCGCCLKALPVVEAVRAEHPFELVIVDIDEEAPPEKLEAYDHQVPVVELDGRKIMKLSVDPARLRRLLRDG